MVGGEGYLVKETPQNCKLQVHANRLRKPSLFDEATWLLLLEPSIHGVLPLDLLL